MEPKQRFVILAESGHFTISELCDGSEISRKSGHKWIKRYQADGLKGLEERSRAPRSSPARTRVKIERLIVGARRRRPTWCPKKIHQILKTKNDLDSPPARSTIGEILKHNGLVSVRYANVRLGYLENTPNARLRPPAYADRWEKRACSAE